MSPPARERRPVGTGGASKSYLSAGHPQRSRFAKSDGPLDEYTRGRERILGERHRDRLRLDELEFAMLDMRHEFDVLRCEVTS